MTQVVEVTNADVQTVKRIADMTEAKSDPNFDKWVAEGARSVAGQHNLLVWAFADELLFEDEKRPGYIGPDRTDIVGL